MLKVWNQYRMSSVGTVGHLPEFGGIVDQPAKIMAGLEICDGAASWGREFFKKKSRRRQPD